MICKALGLMALAGGIALIACGDDVADAKYPSSDSFCAAKAAEECKQVAALCAIPEASCTSRRTDACKAAAGQAMGQGRVYSSSKAEACILKTTEVYKDKVIDPLKESAFKEACERVFSGVKKKNEGCGALYECEGTLTCDLEKGSVCAETVIRTNAQPCANPGETCGKGFYCQTQNSIKVCSAKAKLGEACKLVETPCQEEFRCTNTCVAKQAAGEPCDTSDECVTGLCNTDKKCTARQYASETGSCKDFGG